MLSIKRFDNWSIYYGKEMGKKWERKTKNNNYKSITMTREEFDNLKVGDRIIHAFGGIGVVTEKDESGYTVKDKGFDCGDGCCDVSFAWNEGEIVKNK